MGLFEWNMERRTKSILGVPAFYRIPSHQVTCPCNDGLAEPWPPEELSARWHLELLAPETEPGEKCVPGIRAFPHVRSCQAYGLFRNLVPPPFKGIPKGPLLLTNLDVRCVSREIKPESQVTLCKLLLFASV